MGGGEGSKTKMVDDGHGLTRESEKELVLETGTKG